MKSPRPTPYQLSLASTFNIPLNQAHTINLEKAKAYFTYCNTPECRLEWFLNQEENWRQIQQKREWM